MEPPDSSALQLLVQSFYRLSCSCSAAEMISPLLVRFAYTDCANDGITSRRTPDFDAFHISPDKVTQAVSHWRLPLVRAVRHSAHQKAIKHDHKLKYLTIICVPVNKQAHSSMHHKTIWDNLSNS